MLMLTTTEAAANDMLASVLADFEGDTVMDDGSYTYDTVVDGPVERYMIAGGGPSAWLMFTEHDGTVTGCLEYTDSTGTVWVGRRDAEVWVELRKPMRRDSRAREARR
jgi:hypothetical protein